MTNTTNQAESKVVQHIVNTYKDSVGELKMEIRMLTKHDKDNLLPYYKTALEIIETK